MGRQGRKLRLLDPERATTPDRAFRIAYANALREIHIEKKIAIADIAKHTSLGSSNAKKIAGDIGDSSEAAVFCYIEGLTSGTQAQLLKDSFAYYTADIQLLATVTVTVTSHNPARDAGCPPSP